MNLAGTFGVARMDLSLRLIASLVVLVASLSVGARFGPLGAIAGVFFALVLGVVIIHRIPFGHRTPRSH